MKTKLLAISLLEQNVPLLHSIDQESFFKDFRFFNPLLTVRENSIVKLGLAKVLKYTGIIVGGNIIHNMLFKERTYYWNDKEFNMRDRFSPLGITLFCAPTEYKYSFYPTHFIKRDLVDKVLFSRQQFDYSPFYFKEAYTHLFQTHIEIFQKYVSTIIAETKDLIVFKFRRGSDVPLSFIDLIQTEGPYATQLTEEGFNVWPG